MASQIPITSRVVWLRRVLPLLFLLLVGALSWRELRQIDIHVLRASMAAVPSSVLLGVQALGLVAVLVMTLYDWRVCRWMAITLPPMKLLRYSWVANTFNNFLSFSGLAGSGIRFLLLVHDGVVARIASVYAGILMLSVPVGLAVRCQVYWWILRL